MSCFLTYARNPSSKFSQLLCVLLLIVGRFVNFAVPFLLARLLHVFEQGVPTSPWPYLIGYVCMRFLKSSGGLPALRDVRRTCLQFISCSVHIDFVCRLSGPP